MKNKFIKIIKILRQVSLIKTIIFNVYYFEIKQAIKFPVIVSKNIYFHTLKGNVSLEKYTLGIVKLGFGDIAIFNKKYDKGIWQNTGDICFRGRANIGHGSKISNIGKLEFGDNFIITAKSEIVCCKEIRFGNNCLISWDSLIMDTDFHKIYDYKNNYLNPNKEILIGDDVWIGCRTLILKGSYISTGSVVAANSTIVNNSNVQENILIGGTNKILKKNIKWKI